MKNVLIKGSIVVLSVCIFLEVVIICMLGARRLEYIHVAEMAEDNAKLIKPVTNPPGQSYGTADESLLKNDDGPFTAEDFSYMVIDGIRIDLPCTVGDLAEYFDIRYMTRNERLSAYVCKDDVAFMIIGCDKNDSKPPYSDCEVFSIRFCSKLDSAFIPEIIVGGLNIAAADSTAFQITGVSSGEYAFVKSNLIFETTEKGYIRIDTANDIQMYYYDSYDELCEEVSEDKLDERQFVLLTQEIRLSDTYDPASYEPISLDEIDLSGIDVEITEKPDICIYDELLDEQKYGREARVQICSSEQIDNSHAYLDAAVYWYDEEGSRRDVGIKAILRDGQELGEALILEFY